MQSTPSKFGPPDYSIVGPESERWECPASRCLGFERCTGEILGTDWHSTIGLFFGRAQTRVRKSTKILVALLGGCLLAIGKTLPGFAISSDLTKSWWILPFTVATVSLVILTGSVVLGRFIVGRIPSKLPSALYLVSCPTLAVLSLPTSLPVVTVPPLWVGYAAPALLLTSAWVHYRSLKYSDANEGVTLTSDGLEVATWFGMAPCLSLPSQNQGPECEQVRKCHDGSSVIVEE